MKGKGIAKRSGRMRRRKERLKLVDEKVRESSGRKKGRKKNE